MTATELQELVERQRLYFDPNSSAIKAYNEYLKVLAYEESMTIRPIIVEGGKDDFWRSKEYRRKRIEQLQRKSEVDY